jgi:predicted alpha-1,6-mannanase (GH76 family)
MLAVGAVLGVARASDTPPPASAFMAEAASAAAGLQRWYEGTTYRPAQWWQSANALETTIDYMQATGSRAYVSNLNHTYLAYHQGDRFLDNYYDDDGWWALAWIKAYDLTRDRRYLGQAQAIFDADQTLFKGIFIRKLSKLDSRVDGAPYRAYLRRNASSVWENDRRADEFGLNWSGPFDRPDTARHAAALDALTAGIRAGGV